MPNILAQKAVITDLYVRCWTGRKRDTRITNETNERYQAESDAGNYNKLLIPKEAFKEVFQTCNAARAKHILMTMPWASSSPNAGRMLPTALYSDFANTFRGLRQEYEAAADRFDAAYPNWVGAQQKRLKGMYNPEDYPDPSRVRGMFSFHVSIRPCPDVSDFRVEISKEQAEDIRNALRDELETTLNESMNEPVRRIVAVVGKMADRLKAYKPKTETSRAENTFRDSLVTNIQEMLPLLEAFNLTGNAQLTALTQRIEKELCSSDADILREDDKVRARVAKAADAILKQANALMA